MAFIAAAITWALIEQQAFKLLYLIVHSSVKYLQASKCKLKTKMLFLDDDPVALLLLAAVSLF